MGGFSNVMTGLSLVSNLAGGISSYNDGRRQEEAALKAMQARQQADYQKAAQDAALKRTEIEQEAQKAEAQRKEALKRAVARQRALFGGSGISSSSAGSAQALLLGLFDESEEEKLRREELDKLRYQALDNDLAHRKRINVLALNEEREKQQIGRATDLAQMFGNTTKILS